MNTLTRIRATRLLKNASVDEIARAANISSSYLFQLERAKTCPSTEVAVRLGNALDIAPHKLLDQVYFIIKDSK